MYSDMICCSMKAGIKSCYSGVIKSGRTDMEHLVVPLPRWSGTRVLCPLHSSQQGAHGQRPIIATNNYPHTILDIGGGGLYIGGRGSESPRYMVPVFPINFLLHPVIWAPTVIGRIGERVIYRSSIGGSITRLYWWPRRWDIIFRRLILSMLLSLPLLPGGLSSSSSPRAQCRRTERWSENWSGWGLWSARDATGADRRAGVESRVRSI